MVAEIVKKHRITRRKLAESLGVARVTVLRWEKGYRNPSALAQFALRLIHMHGLDALLSGELGGNERKPLGRKPSKGSKAKTQ